MRIPYKTTPAERLAFALSHPTRRYAIHQALRQGYTSGPLLTREFPHYDPTTIRDVLHVLRNAGFLQADQLILDACNRPRQLTYIPTPALLTAISELQTVCTELLEIARLREAQ